MLTYVLVVVSFVQSKHSRRGACVLSTRCYKESATLVHCSAGTPRSDVCLEADG